jgi:hypothetical protein
MDLLARSRAVLDNPAPGAKVQPWLGAPIVGAPCWRGALVLQIAWGREGSAWVSKQSGAWRSWMVHGLVGMSCEGVGQRRMIGGRRIGALCAREDDQWMWMWSTCTWMGWMVWVHGDTMFNQHGVPRNAPRPLQFDDIQN